MESFINYILLDHEVLHRKKDNTAIQNAYELSLINGITVPDAMDVNTSNGIAKTVMDKMVDFRGRRLSLPL